MKKTWVDKGLCIGCEACVSVDEDDVLFMDEDGLAEAKENNKELKTCQMVCPTGAIKIGDKE
ncbi:ferredoxin [Spiroplasma gladiatoris]|uniref:Ferredoxin n=1 Tax=Spiroplasma gladiatoris TaxID=2143 RepID=A0A4P7AHA3_9MOLU|nr:ferredoxin [Spiroplasma gladiatoris]QBQ07501.1 ferredoxin [Spiroplasma gladiatoris]